MSSEADGEARNAIIRWLEEGPSQLGVVLDILRDHERLRRAAEAADRECERLRNQLETARGESEKLRDEIAHLRRMSKHHLKEREDIADSLSQIMNHVLLRLRSKQR